MTELREFLDRHPRLPEQNHRCRRVDRSSSANRIACFIAPAVPLAPIGITLYVCWLVFSTIEPLMDRLLRLITLLPFVDMVALSFVREAADAAAEPLGRAPAVRDLAERLPERNQTLRLGGLPGSSGAVLAAWLAEAFPQRLLVIVAPTPAEAERWLSDLSHLTDVATVLYPQREALGEDEPHYEIAGERAEAIQALLEGRVRVLVTTARATAATPGRADLSRCHPPHSQPRISDSRCSMFSVLITSTPASRISSTSCHRLALREPGVFVWARSSTSTTSGRRSRTASTSSS